MESFNQCVEGRNELYGWKIQLEHDFDQGKRVSGTKYMKICNLFEDRKNRAIELLEKINMNSRGVRHCMPPIIPKPKLTNIKSNTALIIKQNILTFSILLLLPNVL